ncbi:hypothetical protein JW960_11670 [candidate division KSB1 bacterium]|nr:hypothetical protein [candidate division KSB1 bacterium]
MDRKFKYSDVASIRTAPSLIAPKGDLIHRREYVIKFQNGEIWTTNRLPADLTINQKIDIAQLVSRMSGRNVKEASVLNKDEVYRE